MIACIVGIDPGLHGATAIVSATGRAHCTDLPLVAGRIDAFALYEWIVATIHPAVLRECHVFLEKAQAMPGQGVSSMFNYGVNYGILLGMLSWMQIQYTEVPPSVWKRALHLGKEKEQARLRAMQLFPGVDLHKKADHGKSEALLLAYFGRNILHGRMAHDTIQQ